MSGLKPNVWITRSDSFNSCVEVKWVSVCSNNGCVEVAHQDDKVLVRESKDPDAEPISFMPQTWASTVLAPVMLGRVPNTVEECEAGYTWHGHTVAGEFRRLHFTPREWDAFVRGVKEGLFTPEVGS